MHASPEQLIALRDGDPVDAAIEMHVRECAVCAAEFNTLAELRAMLSRLPDFAVPEGTWEAIRQRADHADKMPGFWRGGLRAAGAAMVAAVVVAVSMGVFPISNREPVDTVVASGVTASASVPQLVMQSRYLENAVLSLNQNADHMIISAGTAATVAALEDRIALVDYEINHASVSSSNRERLTQLWQQRVNLLQSLAAVRYAQVASNDI